MPLAAAADGGDPAAEPAVLRGLVVGSYCHDVLLRGGRVVGETLGGGASFVSNVLDTVSPASSSALFVSKVGADFAYFSSVALHPPIAAPSSPTTLFHADFAGEGAPGCGGDRRLRRVRACDPIYASDLPDGPPGSFAFGLAAGVAGELLRETLDRMLRLCRVVLVDVQGLIRSFDGAAGGDVGLVPLESTPFVGLLPRVAFLKASSEEAPYVRVEEARRLCCVIVTEGKDGCRLYWKDGEVHVKPFPAVQVDPTGAGDSFLGGFVAGLLWGLTVPDAALVGNFFGAATVAQIGVPKFDQKMVQAVKQILEQKANQRASSCLNGATTFAFHKSNIHDELQASLQEAARYMCDQQPTDLAICNDLQR